MKLILHYLKRYKGLFALNILSVFGFALVELGIPTIVSDMIDNGIMYQDKPYLLRMGAVIVVISVIGVAGTILLGYCCAKMQHPSPVIFGKMSSRKYSLSHTMR